MTTELSAPQSMFQRIRGFTTMRYINLRFTYLLTFSWSDERAKLHGIQTDVLVGTFLHRALCLVG